MNRGAPQFVRFMNPSDYRVAREACGACHLEVIQKAERSLMSTGAMFLEGATYNNGILPNKAAIIGEGHTAQGQPARGTHGPHPPAPARPAGPDPVSASAGEGHPPVAGSQPDERARRGEDRAGPRPGEGAGAAPPERTRAGWPLGV